MFERGGMSSLKAVTDYDVYGLFIPETLKDGEAIVIVWVGDTAKETDGVEIPLVVSRAQNTLVVSLAIVYGSSHQFTVGQNVQEDGGAIHVGAETYPFPATATPFYAKVASEIV